jgi:transposase InsO family protein
MKKEEIRREFFKLKDKGHSYSQCRTIIKAKYDFETSIRTLKRWTRKLGEEEWNLRDKSRRPLTVHHKIDEALKMKILELRKKTGWGEDKLALYFPVSHTSVNKVLNEANICRESENKGKRKKWVRWQRKHPNSLWQIDHTDEQDLFNCYTLSVIDDCSRYSLALVKLNHVTTDNVTQILDELIKKHGKPKQILTDNGGAYGLNSRHSRFDRWCRRRGIQHIRTKIHSPTTNGKVERLFKTMDEEMNFCNNDFELFRLRYNHFRPHSSLNNKAPAEVYFAFHVLF